MSPSCILDTVHSFSLEHANDMTIPGVLSECETIYTLAEVWCKIDA